MNLDEAWGKKTERGGHLPKHQKVGGICQNRPKSRGHPQKNRKKSFRNLANAGAAVTLLLVTRSRRREAGAAFELF